MGADDRREDLISTTGRLVGDVLAGGVGMIRDVHRAIAGRWFTAVGPAAWPVRVMHDGIAGGVYAVVGAAHAFVPRAAGVLAASVSAGGGADGGVSAGAGGGVSAGGGADGGVSAGAGGGVSAGGGADGGVSGGAGGGVSVAGVAPRAGQVLAAVNGLWGDRISERYPALAIAMTVRAHGADVPITADGLRAAEPAATSRVAVFVHGLCEDDRFWSPPIRGGMDGDTAVSYGSLLRRDAGYTPVYLRFNTGRRVSDNGRQLAALMAELHRHWPVPIEEIAFVGHSMGGLVVRAACHYGEAAGHDWVPAVRHVFCLGTPHLGAPLEKGVNATAWLLSRLPETAPVATVLNLRSVGVKDLRYGAVVEEDWRDVDVDEFLRDRCTEVPFLDHARYYFIGATITRSPGHPVGRLLGDLLVQLPSAAGQGRRRRIPFPVDQGLHLGGLNHFDLLHHPAVYRRIHTWITDA